MKAHASMAMHSRLMGIFVSFQANAKSLVAVYGTLLVEISINVVAL